MKTCTIPLTAALLLAGLGFAALPAHGQYAYTQIKSFSGSGGEPQYPRGGVIEGSDGALYGTSTLGGTGGGGTVYKVNKDGTGFTVLRTRSIRLSSKATGGSRWAGASRFSMA